MLCTPSERALQAEQPTYHVPEYLQANGVQIVPVPVYFPEATEILGEQVVRSVEEAGQPLDCVCVFRRPVDVPAHVPDLLASRPKCVWLQLGIRSDESAEALARAGILVVQDKCLLLEHAAARRTRR